MKGTFEVIGSTTVHAAKVFATAAHYAIDQRRKYTGEPYINHPERVVRLVQSVNAYTYQVICAAWLHDVVEDTAVPLSVIESTFGQDVSEMVGLLTDVGTEYGNRAKRKAYDRARLADAPGSVQTIKVADLIDNTSTIVQHDPEFAKLYLQEKRQLLDVLTKADRTLWDRANAMLPAA